MADTEDLSLEETVAFLTDRAHARFGKIPTKLIVDQVLRVTEGTDFPVRRAAIEALERRLDNTKREGLHVVSMPDAAPGWQYRVARIAESGTGRRARESRPYLTEFSQIEPLSMSCGCPDFLKGSLGLCKHTLAVLLHVYSSPKRAARLSKRGVSAKPTTSSRLCWDPIWPFVDAVDRLAGLHWQGQV